MQYLRHPLVLPLIVSVIVLIGVGYSRMVEPADRLRNAGICTYLDKYSVDVVDGRVIYSAQNVVIAELTKLSPTKIEWRRFNASEPSMQAIIIDAYENESSVGAIMQSTNGSRNVLVCNK